MRRRPAAAPAVRRRPAAEGVPPPERGREGEDIIRKYQRGEVVQAHQLPPQALEQGHWLASEQSTYFGEDCKWAGKIARVVLEGGEAEAQVEVTGTQCESLLRFCSGQSPALVRAHLCAPECDQKRTNPDFVHLKAFRKLEEAGDKTWENNLVVADENAPLRRAEERWNQERLRDEKKDTPSSSRSTSSSKKKKKKKEKKKAEVKKKEKRCGGRTLAKKLLTDLFNGTGLDPDPKVRRRIIKKVRKRLRRSKESASSSSGSSSTGSALEMEEEILEDRSKIQKISVLGPGVLTAAAIQSMKQYVLQPGGSTWAMDEDALPPIMSQYARMHLAPKGGGGLLREAVTLSHIGDLLLQGRVSEALDGVSQRLKSLELIMGGQAWATAQKVEVTPTLEASISSRAEVQVALKESRLDSQSKGGMSPWEKGRGKGKSKDKERGKSDKGKGNAKEEGKRTS